MTILTGQQEARDLVPLNDIDLDADFEIVQDEGGMPAAQRGIPIQDLGGVQEVVSDFETPDVVFDEQSQKSVALPKGLTEDETNFIMDTELGNTAREQYFGDMDLGSDFAANAFSTYCSLTR